jgi:hypothetical protein
MKKSFIRIAIVVGLILLVPLVAMQFTDEVGWDLADFVVMGALLFGAGLALDFAVKKLIAPAYQALAVIAIVIIFLLMWAELAVGIFGTPFAGS